MHRRISTTLNTLRQDLAAGLAGDFILKACRLCDHTWSDSCLLTPAAIIHWFLVQDSPRQHCLDPRVHVGWPRLHRFRLLPSYTCRSFPLAVSLAVLREMVKGWVPATEATGHWLGHRVFLEDGSAFSMPDTQELQAHFGQPGNQAKGCGFPVAHILALFHAGTGATP